MDEKDRQIADLTERLKKIEGVLFSVDNDPRFSAKVREQIFTKEHAAGKPQVIINRKGTTYNLETV